MKKLIVIATSLFYVALAMPAQAVEQPTYDPEESADRVIKVKDYNQDGIIAQAEYERIALLQFNKIDTDGDQFISANEMFEYRYAGRSELNIKTPAVREKIMKNMMTRWDSNDDQRISVDEKLKSVRSEFGVIDRDQDQIITRDEMVSYWQQKKNEMEQARGKNRRD